MRNNRRNNRRSLLLPVLKIRLEPFVTCPSNRYEWRFANNISWSAVSNALFRSRKGTPLIKPASVLYTSLVKLISDVSAECCGRKPDCSFQRTLLSKINYLNWWYIIPWNSLANAEITETPCAF